MMRQKTLPSFMMKKTCCILGIALLIGSGSLAQDSTFLWTAGSSIMNLYNLDNFYTRTIESPWPYTQKNQPVPVIYEKKVWITSSSTGTHFSAVADDGMIYSWTKNTNASRAPSVSQNTQSAGDWKQILHARSQNTYYLLAKDSIIYSLDRSIEQAVPGEEKWLKMVSTSTAFYALRSDSTVWRWAKKTGDVELINKTQLGVGVRWVDLAAVAANIYGINEDGTLWALYTTMRPFHQQGADNDWKKLFAESALFAIKENNTLWTLGGRNEYGQLGTGNTNSADELTQIGTDTDWDKILPGASHNFGFKTDGKLFAWGRNTQYQLGISGNNTNQLSPVQVGDTGEYQMAIPGDQVSTFFRPWGYDGETSTPSSTPAAPTNLTASPANSILLNWQDNSANEDGFRIESATDANGPWSLIETTAPDVTSYTHTGLTGGVEYFYRIQAFNSSGASSFSNVAHAVEITTGVYGSIFSKLSIYPNPADNSVTINHIPHASMLRISDLTGHIKYEQLIVNNRESVNISDFEEGIYLIQIINNEKVLSKKFIVRR